MQPENNDLTKIEPRLNELVGKEYISDSTVEFFRKIFSAQHTIKKRLLKQLETGDIPSLFSNGEIEKKLKNGKPLLSTENPPIDKPLLKDLFYELCSIIKAYATSSKENSQEVIDPENAETIDTTMLIKNLLAQNSEYFHILAQEIKISEDLLVFYAIQLAKPFFETAAERLKDKVKGEQWLKNSCPVCGSAPQMARLEREDGKRILSCTLCGTQWRYMRLKCPFCCSDQASGMKFIAEEKGAYRVELCEQCKRYIKTLDERKASGGIKEFIPSVEDLATMYLDMLAEKRGYKRTWFFPPSVENLKSGRGSTSIH